MTLSNGVGRCALVLAAMLGTGQARAEKYPKVQREALFAPSVDHSAEASQLLWINKPGSIKGLSKVVIPFFQVQFVQDSDASASNIDGNSSSMLVQLKGPSDAQMQAITDRAYAKLVADLTAAGITVLPAASAGAYPSFAKLEAGGKPTGTRIDGMKNVNSKFFAPAGMNFYFLPTQDVMHTGGGMFANMALATVPRSEQALMTESGAAVLGFRAVVDFATVSSGNSGFFGRLKYSASTKSKAGIAIRPIGTQLYILTPATQGTMMDPSFRYRMEVQAPLLVDTQAITAMTNANTTGDRVGMGVVNALSLLSGGGMHSAKKFDVVVDPAVWERDVSGAIAGVEEMMVHRLKSEL